MTPDELDELVSETEKCVALAHLDALIALCDRAEAERALTEVATRNSGTGEHMRLYGHRLTFGCCLRAFESGAPSIFDGA
jgi:hypothetical protein